MKDYIDIQERPSWGRMLPLSFQHLFAMFGSTVLVPYLLKVDPATALFMNGIGTLLYLFVCKGKIPAYLGSSFAFIAPVAGAWYCCVPWLHSRNSCPYRRCFWLHIICLYGRC